MEFKLIYYNSIFQCFNHYTKGTPSNKGFMQELIATTTYINAVDYVLPICICVYVCVCVWLRKVIRQTRIIFLWINDLIFNCFIIRRKIFKEFLKELMSCKKKSDEKLTSDGRLNGVVSPVTRFEELSYTMSPFWSHYRMNRRWADMVVHSSAVSSYGLPPLFSWPEKNKCFTPFCCMDFSVFSLNACDSCRAWVGNLVPYLYWIQINVIWY